MADLSQMSDDDLQKLYAQAQAPKDAPATDLSHLTDEDLTKLYQQSQGQSAPASKVPPLMSSAVGAAQAVTLEHAPQIAAGANTLKDYLLSKINGEPLGVDFGTAYQRNLEHAQGRLEEAKSENPGFYTAGGIGGALGSAALLPEAAMATRGARLATGAALGAGAAGGASQHDPTQSAEELKKYLGDVAMGGGMGLVGGGLGEAIPAAIGAAKKVPGALENVAEQAATKATVGRQAAYDRLRGQGRVNDVGRELLDSGVVGFGDNAAAISAKGAAAKAGAGEDISRIIQTVDEAAPNSVSGPEIARKINQYAAQKSGAGNQSLTNQLTGFADAFEKQGNMSMADAMTHKTSFEYQGGDRLQAQAMNKVRKIVGDEMEEAAGRAGLPDADLSGANKTYGALATAEKEGGKLAARQEKNRGVGLLPTITGTGAAVMGYQHGGSIPAAIAGLGVAAGHKLIQNRGSAALAVGADKLADILRATPEALGPFAPMLQDAATKGTTSLALTHYLLSKDPSYVQTVNQAAGATP